MANEQLVCSVVVPAYNAARTLDACLQALNTQTTATDAYEIILVDDGSRDNTAEIAQRHGVRLIRQENRGPAAARNRGVAEARSDIVLFTDADCQPQPDWIENMLVPFADPQVTGVQGAYLTRQTFLTARFAQAEFEDRYELMARFESIDLVATYAAGFRRALFLRMGGFDDSFPVANNEDTDFSYRLCEAGHKLVFAPEARVFHQHPGSLRKYLRTKYWRGYWRMIVYRRYPEKAVKDRYTSTPVKLQTLLMLAVYGLLPLALFWSPARWLLFCLLVAVPVTGKSLIRRAWNEDRILGMATPFYVVLRAVVLSAGSLHGLIACLLKKK
jgi:glycosyltransferase involved in cell wall biosynthesis